MLQEFRAFILRGNVVDLAVGVIIGAAFTAIVNALLKGLINPLLALIGGEPNFDDLAFKIGDTEFPYGTIITAVVAFVIVAAAVFFFVVKPVNHMMDRYRTEPDVEQRTRKCPECLSEIPGPATRCAFCTAESAPVS